MKPCCCFVWHLRMLFRLPVLKKFGWGCYGDGSFEIKISLEQSYEKKQTDRTCVESFSSWGQMMMQRTAGSRLLMSQCFDTDTISSERSVKAGLEILDKCCRWVGLFFKSTVVFWVSTVKRRGGINPLLTGCLTSIGALMTWSEKPKKEPSQFFESVLQTTVAGRGKWFSWQISTLILRNLKDWSTEDYPQSSFHHVLLHASVVACSSFISFLSTHWFTMKTSFSLLGDKLTSKQNIANWKRELRLFILECCDELGEKHKNTLPRANFCLPDTVARDTFLFWKGICNWDHAKSNFLVRQTK